MPATQLPDAKGQTALMRHLLGVTEEERQQRREEILGTSLKDFRAFGDALQSAFSSGRQGASVAAVTSVDAAAAAVKERPELGFTTISAAAI